ncbi:MAG: N-6 DNA methylase, partial [Acidobacteriota bacterium]
GSQIPACLWFLARNKNNGLPAPGGARQAGKFRDRRGQTLFIDARKMGYMADRTHRDLSDEEITRIANTYHAWRTVGPHPASGHPLPLGEGQGEGVAVYRDIPGFCKSATTEEIAAHGYVLTPGRYVGAEAQDEDDEPFDERMQHLTGQLREQTAEARRLDEAIWKNLKELGYDG